MMNWFVKKRKQIIQSLPKQSALILASAPVSFRQPDVSHPYRQESNFYYLSGFSDSPSLLILSHQGSALFIPDKDPHKETWDGKLLSTAEAKKQFKISNVYYWSDLKKHLPKYLKNKKQIFYDKKLNPDADKLIHPWIKNKKLTSAKKHLAIFRRYKDATEIKWMKQAVAISKHAHAQIAKNLKPGINERALHGIFLKAIMEKGSPRESYGSIIACGNNANTLHYIKNDSLCKAGELLLVDAGAEFCHYASDITRVYPVSGKFTQKQKQLYQLLLNLQKQLIKEVRPGCTMKNLNDKMQEGIIEILIEIKILKASQSQAAKNKAFYKYAPHSVGHLLGMDVHDPYFKPRKSLTLEPGMVITIEPGIYIPKEAKEAPKELRGVGLRIEDNILVTKSSHQNLSAQIPKEVRDIERLCKTK